MEDKRTEISELGEFNLIDRLTATFNPSNSATVLGVGDDASALQSTGNLVVCSTDMLNEGVHFDLSYVPLKHLGYKAVMVNLSDIYAMNATPKQILVSLAISNRFSVEALEELYAGIQSACDKYHIDLVGGDTTSSINGLMISVTAIGEVEEEKMVQRKGAKENDLLVVSGDLGGAYMGLQILEREKEVFSAAPTAQPDLSGHEYILERQLKPEARKDIIELLETISLVPTSMIDVSDGLASEIFHLAKESQLGCNLFEEKLPIDPGTINSAREFNLDPTTCVLNGGEDYELLFTISQDDYDKVKASPHLTVIGHMTKKSEGCHLHTKGGTVVPLEAQGWQAFKKD